MHLALTDMFKARWTAQIHDEWMRNVHNNMPDIPFSKLERTRDLMDMHVRDALVTGYEPLIDILSLHDLDDRHVLAAAIKCGAGGIITMNVKDFPASELEKWDIEAIHPDDFICSQIDLHPGKVCKCVKDQRELLKKPPRTVQEHLDHLRAIPLPQTVQRLSEYETLL